MIRIDRNRNARNTAGKWVAGSAATLAAVIGAALITAAPAQAEHVEDAVAGHIGRVAASHFLLAGELLFGGPPVVVHHRYEEPRYHRGHRHHARCGHGDGHRHHGKHFRKHHRKHGHHARHHRGDGHRRDYARYDGGHRRTIPPYERREVMHRGGRH